MTPGLVWFLLIAGHVLAFCLLAIASAVGTAAVFVTAVAVLELLVWQRQTIAAVVSKEIDRRKQRAKERREELAEIHTLINKKYKESIKPTTAQNAKPSDNSFDAMVDSAIGVDGQGVTDAEIREFTRDRRLSYFHTKVVGVTKKNRNGSSRQAIIADCFQHEQLSLVHDKGNRFDKYAIKVCRQDGGQLGFLRSEIAEDLMKSAKQGWDYKAFICGLTGGEAGKQLRGCNLIIGQASPDVPKDIFHSYVKARLQESE